MTDNELFLTAILNCSRSELFTQSMTLSEGQEQRLAHMHRRRAAGEPVQYICGFTDFMGYRIEVGKGVLVPRPETEVLADAVICWLNVKRPTGLFILDIGTGSGCIPVALVKAVEGCQVVAVDISETALLYARRNTEMNAVSGRISLMERDMFWYMDETADRFDVITSNPPYIPSFMLDQLPMDVRQEPLLALDGGPDGLHFYRQIVPKALRLLKDGGLLAMEFGDGQRKELENLFIITGGWDKIRIIKDNAGKDRIVMAQKTINEQSK